MDKQNQELKLEALKERKIISLNQENILAYIDDLCVIELANFPLPCSRKLYLSEIQTNEKANYLAITIDDQLVAYGGYWLIFTSGEVTNIAVAETWRGLGLGRELVVAMLQDCKLKGGLTMSLEVRKSNQVAIGLYQSLGFKLLGVRKNYYEDNQEDALIMEASLV